jgi:hypothetical protein
VQLPTFAANAQVSGAASRLRIYWPDKATDTGYGTASKLGAQAMQQGATGTAGGGTITNTIYGGVDVIKLLGGAYWIAPGSVFFTERTGGAVVCDTACAELRLTVAFDNPGGVVAGDMGLVICNGGISSGMNQNGTATNAGVVFGPQNSQTIQLRARAANAGPQTVTETVSAANTPDITKFNTYALRIVSGSATSDPVLFGLINGRVVTQRYSWTAAAGILPGIGQVSGSPSGWKFLFSNWVVASGAYVIEGCITWAPTESALD